MPAPRVPQTLLGKSKRLHIITDFAINLEERVSGCSFLIDDQLLESLKTHVRSLHAYSPKPSNAFNGHDELDRLGTSIWNCSTRLPREMGGNAVSSERRKLAVYSRVFAFHLLDAAQRPGNAGLGNEVRLMRLALKAGRTAIEASELEMASFVLQKGADYTAYFTEHSKNLDGEDATDVRGLEAEYYILRTALSWKEDRLDVAEHMYNKGHLTGRSLPPHQVEKLAEVLYDIGKDTALKKDFPMAAKWLERAQDIINSHDLEKLSREALELRTAIWQAYISTLVNLGSIETLGKADNLIHFLQSEMGTTMGVLVLRLELLTKAPAEVFDGDAYAAILSQMITCFSQKDVAMDLAEQSAGDPDFRLIMHHIGKLDDKAPTLGMKVLDQFITALARSEHVEWVERLVTKRIWMATNRGDLGEAIEAAHAAISQVQKPLGPDATAAVQTLIWKYVDSVYNQQLYDTAELWCKLALHRIFENTGPLNRAKIERKLILCSMRRNDIDGARSIYHAMAEETQKEPRTLYLLYKIAIRSDDLALALTCLEGISKTPEPTDYLYSCCLEALNARQIDFAIEALGKLLEKKAQSPSTSVHLPALLRCSIRLAVKDLETHKDEDKRHEEVTKLCDLFEQVATSIEHPTSDPKTNPFSATELDWFARNAYNLGLTHVEAWEVPNTIRLLTACNAIMSHFPDSISADISEDIGFKTLFNNFILASALLSRARGADNREEQLQDYLLVRHRVAAFDASLPSQIPILVDVAKQDMRSKLAALLAFDFEAAVALKSWDDLPAIVRKTAEETHSATSLQAQADILLRASPPAPTQVVYSVLRGIINALFELDQLDTPKLARYMRCLLQITLPFDDELAFGLVKDYIGLLEDARTSNTPLPKEETDWLASTTYNHGVDHWLGKRYEACRKWCYKAFDLTRLMGDGGALEGVLHERFNTLNFDVQD
ncbi:meiosis protein SPO22/ZIP4 like-domain-containing protein [Coniochaeta sp. 2T2.1]|nr:meiosis protein SPO22/ZIP4 like-domain-containing protein [Coniochaeta sp. 2T2.1]